MLPRYLVRSGLLASLLVVGASAQSVFVPDNNALVGTCNVIPFGHRVGSTEYDTWANQKYQTILTPAQLGFGRSGTGTICDLAFAPCVSGIRKFDTIEIKLDHVQGTTLSQTFSANITASAVTVLKATNYEWHNTANQWNRIGLQRNFFYVAATGSLCIEITVTGAGLVTSSTAGPGYRRSSTIERRYAHGWSKTPPAQGNSGTSLAAAKIEVLFGMNDLHTFGSGCPGSNTLAPALSLTGSAKLGQTVTVSLSHALANASLYLNIAATTHQPPLDLTRFGAPGCHLYSPVQLLLMGLATSTGTHSLQFGIPNDKNLLCQRAYLQYFPFDKKANNLWLSASNYGRVLVGN